MSGINNPHTPSSTPNIGTLVLSEVLLAEITRADGLFSMLWEAKSSVGPVVRLRPFSSVHDLMALAHLPRTHPSQLQRLIWDAYSAASSFLFLVAKPLLLAASCY